MTCKTFTAEVEVGLEEFDDDDIATEYVTRGLGRGDLTDVIEEMYHAFKLGKEDRAVDLARQIAQDSTGRLL